MHRQVLWLLTKTCHQLYSHYIQVYIIMYAILVFYLYSTISKLLTIYYCVRWDRLVENVGMKGSFVESAYEPAEQIYLEEYEIC